MSTWDGHGLSSVTRIERICPRCDHFIEANLGCRLLYGDRFDYLKVFEGKPCRPRDYLVNFVRARLRRTNEINVEHRAEDVAQAVIQQLHEKPRAARFLSRDVVGLRRFLAAKATHTMIDERRSTEGRMRCGNCRYHLRTKNGRICGHSDPRLPWTGRLVKASEHPRRFDPPCYDYRAKLPTKSLEDQPPGWEPTTADPGPLRALEESQGLGIAADCFAALQRKHPQLWQVARLFFFDKMTVGEIADHLGVSSKTVRRRKANALSLLKKEFLARDVHNLEALV